MDSNLSIFNQINSLSYWFLAKSNYKCNVVLDAEKNTYFVTIKKAGKPLYSHCISEFSQKNKNLLKFELTAIANSLLHIKEQVTLRNKSNSSVSLSVEK